MWMREQRWAERLERWALHCWKRPKVEQVRSDIDWFPVQTWSQVDQLHISYWIPCKNTTQVPFTHVVTEKVKVGGRWNFVAISALFSTLGALPWKSWSCAEMLSSVTDWLQVCWRVVSRGGEARLGGSYIHSDCLASWEVQTWENNRWQKVVLQ